MATGEKKIEPPVTGGPRRRRSAAFLLAFLPKLECSRHTVQPGQAPQIRFGRRLADCRKRAPSEGRPTTTTATKQVGERSECTERRIDLPKYADKRRRVKERRGRRRQNGTTRFLFYGDFRRHGPRFFKTRIAAIPRRKNKTTQAAWLREETPQGSHASRVKAISVATTVGSASGASGFHVARFCDERRLTAFVITDVERQCFTVGRAIYIRQRRSVITCSTNQHPNDARRYGRRATCADNATPKIPAFQTLPRTKHVAAWKQCGNS